MKLKKALKKIFKKRINYAPVAYLGRKNVEKILGAKIRKDKELDGLEKSQC